MAHDVIMPALGIAQDTGRIVAWLRSEGDAVTEGEPLIEVETDKTTVQLDAPATGTLARVSHFDGADVPVGQTIAVILAPGEVDAAPAPASERPPASPKARRIAAERGIALESIGGTGPAGAITAADVAAAPSRSAPRGGDQPFGRTWGVMARRMVESWTTAPHFSLERDVRADRIIALLTAVRRRTDQRLTITDVLVRLAAAALREHPAVNVAWDGAGPAVRKHINVGLAVALPDGLVVPVIHRADTLDLAGVARRRSELVAAARAGRLAPADLADGTFTITNLGMFGVDRFTAILNPPQAAILAVGRIAERVIAVGGNSVVAPMVSLTLTGDHRAIDGARLAAYLTTLAQLVEEPALLAEPSQHPTPTREVSNAE